MACYNYNRQEDKFNMLNSIIKSLNWLPNTSLIEGLEKTIQYFIKEN